MAWLGIFIGLICGAALWRHDGGWLIGALLGWLVGRDLERSKQLRELMRRSEQPARTDPAQVAGRMAAAVRPEPPSQADAGHEAAPPAAISTAIPVEPPATDPAPALPEPEPATPGQPAIVVPAPAPATAAPAPAPNPTDLADRLPRWLVAGNPAVKIGVLLVLMGAAFLLKYAAQYVRFPLELRYLGVLAAGAAGIGFGWRQRAARPAFAHALQGGGLGIAFLTVFTAFRLHGLVPAGAAFALLAGLAVASGALALAQSAQALAVIGLAGGFLAPILASTGHGDPVLLFGYYAVLNLGIAYVAHARAWRGLNLLGFAFTFAVGAAWGVLRYQPADFARIEPFLLGFWLFYLALAIVFARRRLAEAGLGSLARDPVDAALVFGVPLLGFGLQAALVGDFAYGEAWSAAAMAAVYAAAWRFVRRQPGQALLAEAFCALAIGFATVAVPLAGGAHWTAASWSLEGAALVWVGGRQDRRLARWAGYLLIFLAGLVALADLAELRRADRWLNGALLGTLLATAASWLAGAACHRRGGLAAMPLLLWGLLLGLAGGFASLFTFAPAWSWPAGGVGLLAAAGLLLTALSAPLRWPHMRVPGLALPLALGIALLAAAGGRQTPLQDGGWLAWPIAFAVWWIGLRRRETELPRAGRRLVHLTGAWLWLLLASWTLSDAVGRIGVDSAWHWLGALLPFAGLLALAARLPAIWPLRRYRAWYGFEIPAPAAILAYALLLAAPWASTGAAAPLPWLPLLNPLDLGWWLTAAALAAWLCSRYPALRLAAQRQAFAGAGALAVFGWLNATLAHAFHHWGGLAFNRAALWPDSGYQAALAILWGGTALATMLAANRYGRRDAWLAGAALIGATVLKLFAVDLASAGGLARVVAFIGVGVLLVVVGYLAPAPAAYIEEKH
ncbi:DUF2339 domain-containing protein [Chitinimonas koreensis]|uniref:DUF2339 domain-containing protein n=1 Tax=Chitinimonas koreensis TaxID=356302 RepID=UPI00048F7236|nr:DUF2339 domain-containing protein [Chitinimonas koreensis]QNM97246.1 DUF2339 domain-containing protein [Chitinimonas koreensis]